MPYSEYYNTFNGNIGKAVEIRTHDGNIHRGTIHSVDNDHVYLQPFESNTNDISGGPYGAGTYFWGFWPGVFAISLATIAAFSWLWWW